MAVPTRSRLTFQAAIALALAGGILLGLSLVLGLNGDVQYVIGVQDVRGGGIGGAIGTFAHRPVGYRVFLGLIDDAMRLIGLRPSVQVAYEVVIRLVGVALAVVAAWSLARGLRGRLGRLAEAWTSIAVGLALAFAPNWDFLQPEWVATLFAVLAIGTALSLPRLAVAGGLCGGLLVAAVAAKVSTAPIALLGLLVIAVLDRRRAVAGGIGTVAWLLVALAVLAAFPLERQWLGDMISLNPNSVLRSGITVDRLVDVARSIASKAALSPAVQLLPAASTIVGRSLTRGPKRLAWAAFIALATLLTAAPMLSQGETYLYQLAALPVLAAGICGYAAGRWADRGMLPVAIPIPLAVAATLGAGLMITPKDWRLANLDALVLLVLGAAAILAILAVRFRSMPATTRGLSDAREPRVPAYGPQAIGLVVAASIAILPIVLPATAWSLNPRVSSWGNASWEAESRFDQRDLGTLSVTI